MAWQRKNEHVNAAKSAVRTLVLASLLQFSAWACHGHKFEKYEAETLDAIGLHASMV